MPETTSSVYKTLSWLLAILLIATVALLSWFSGNRKEVLAGKDARIAQSTQLVAEVEHRLGRSEETSQALRAEIQGLRGELETATRARETLQGDMAALEAQQARALAAEQEEARQAYTRLQGQHDAANAQIAALGADIAQLKRTMADSAAAHEAQTLQLEHRMKEKIDFYRTALEGSEPERAAQLVGLERQLQENQQVVEDARQATRAMQVKAANLEEQLAGANQGIAERDQALSETGQALEAVRADLAQEQTAHKALQRKHEETVTRTTGALATLKQDLDAANTAHSKTRLEAAAALQAANEAHTARMTEAERKISGLSGRLQAETAALAALQQKHDAMATELRSSLDATEKTLAGVEDELSTTKDAAARAQEAHERQLADDQSTITGLEQTLEQTRQTAAQDLAASRHEGEETAAYVRGIYKEFSKLGGQHTDRGMLLSLADDDLRFRIGRAELPDSEPPSLDWIAGLLVKHPKLTARIEGHTDNKGRDKTNLELSRQRAEAVKQALIERGVEPQRMVTEGIGAVRPIADNAGSAGRRKNRRVEIYILEN